MNEETSVPSGSETTTKSSSGVQAAFKNWLIVLVILLAVLAGSWWFIQNKGSQVFQTGAGKSALRLTISSAELGVDEQGKLSVVYDGSPQPVSAWEAYITYDPNVVQFDVNNASVGDSLVEWQTVFAQVHEIDANTAQLRISYYTLEPQALSRKTELVSVPLVGVAVGQTDLKLDGSGDQENNISSKVAAADGSGSVVDKLVNTSVTVK